MNKAVASVLGLALLLGFSACQKLGGKGIPEELRGVWVTEARNYERCSLEITGDKLIFENGLTLIDINFVKGVERAMEGNMPRYTIHYENREGERQKISVLFVKKDQGGVLCFKNQKNITWTKRGSA